MTLVGFVDRVGPGRLLSYPLGTMDSLLQWDYDAVVIAGLTRTKKVCAQLLATGVFENKLFSL